MKCHNCNEESDYLERTNPTGEKGVFMCVGCVQDRTKAIADLMDMSAEELELVDHDLVKWNCSVKGCSRHTKVKDFGIRPVYYWRKRWWDLTFGLYWCSKHWKFYRRLKKTFDDKTIQAKLVDKNKQKIESITK